MFWNKFNAAAPGLFGALLDGLVGAMKVREQFGGDTDRAAEELLGGWRPRFVDAVVWAEAACTRMGFQPGEFTQAYKNNQDVGLRYIAENDPVCIGIRKLMANRDEEWRGIPTELVAALRPFVGVILNSLALSRDQLPRVIPVLDKVYGIPVLMGKRIRQNDNRTGIIIGVPRGTMFSPEVISLSEKQPETNLVKPKPGFLRRL